MEIMAERCNECLYGPDKIVSNSRRAKILRKLKREDGYFICHKATIAGLKYACRGDWDQRRCGQMGRIADRLGLIKFVNEQELTDAQD